MGNTIFTGAATALITPLNAHGVDYESFDRLIDWQIEEGINGLVVCGTTGENATLNDEEHKEAIKHVVKKVNGRVKVIAGTGSNDTRHAVEFTKYAGSVGADAVLTVTPYYNKATQNGLIKSFEAIAEASSVPMILYNVPSRTGCNIQPETCAVLADHPRIAAIKEASGNISQIAKTASLIRGKMDLYSGNDDQIVPVLSLGGKGVISVLSNVMPRTTVEICSRYFKGDTEGARDIQLDLMSFIDALFCEVNPIPVKAAAAAMGYCEDYLRLPLTSLGEDKKKIMFSIMEELKLI